MSPGRVRFRAEDTVENPKVLLLVLYVVFGSGLVAASIPLICGMVGPNAWYGFRVKRTLADPATWYKVNRYAAFQMLTLGVAVVLIAVALYPFPQVDFVHYALACVGVLFVGLGVNLFRTFRFLKQFPR